MDPVKHPWPLTAKKQTGTESPIHGRECPSMWPQESLGTWTLVLMPVQIPDQHPSACQTTSLTPLLLAWQEPQLTNKNKGCPHCSLTELRPGTRANTESWKMSLSDLVAGAGISNHQHGWLRRGSCVAMAAPMVGGSGSHQTCLYLHPLQLNCWSGGLSIFLIPQLNPQNRNVVRIVSSGETSWARQRERNLEEMSRAQKPMPFSRLLSLCFCHPAA